MMMREIMKAIQITSTIAHPRMGTFQTNMKAISIENGSNEDPQVTINDINIIEEMNTSQIYNNDGN